MNLEKYEKDIYTNLDKENIKKIIKFLEKNGCDFIEELLDDYLDIFTFEYNEFIEKYNKLNIKYNNNLIYKISNDMNILEEFYLV